MEDRHDDVVDAEVVEQTEAEERGTDRPKRSFTLPEQAMFLSCYRAFLAQRQQDDA